MSISSGTLKWPAISMDRLATLPFHCQYILYASTRATQLFFDLVYVLKLNLYNVKNCISEFKLDYVYDYVMSYRALSLTVS